MSEKQDKKTKSILNKYKDKKEGFSTKTHSDMQKDRDRIKHGYYKKGALLFIATLLILASIKFFSGDYQPRRSGDVSNAPLLKDEIDVGSGEPSLEIIKGELGKLKDSQAKLEDEYQKKLLEAQAQANQKIDQLEAEIIAKREAEKIKIEQRDQNKSDEAIQEVKNAFLSEIAGIKAQMREAFSGKSEILPPLEGPAQKVSTKTDDKKLLSSVEYKDSTPKENGKKAQSKPKLVYEDFSIASININDGIGEGGKDKNISKNTIAFDITTGLSEALLITGVQAPTFGAGAGNPKPVMVSFTSPIMVANDESINIQECTGLGAAIGNMNTKRAEITITRLNCIVRKHGETYKVSQKIKAYLIGEDGSYGLRGRLVDSGSKVVMRQIQTGFLQGVSQAFVAAVQPPVTVNSYGTNGTTTLPSTSDAAQLGMVNGGVSGLNSLVEYYKQMMDGLYPTISVRGGRSVGVLWPGGESFTLTATRLFDVDGSNHQKKTSHPFQTEYDEELDYEEW